MLLWWPGACFITTNFVTMGSPWKRWKKQFEEDIANGTIHGWDAVHVHGSRPIYQAVTRFDRFQENLKNLRERVMSEVARAADDRRDYMMLMRKNLQNSVCTMMNRHS